MDLRWQMHGFKMATIATNMAYKMATHVEIQNVHVNNQHNGQYGCLRERSPFIPHCSNCEQKSGLGANLTVLILHLLVQKCTSDRYEHEYHPES